MPSKIPFVTSSVLTVIFLIFFGLLLTFRFPNNRAWRGRNHVAGIGRLKMRFISEQKVIIYP